LITLRRTAIMNFEGACLIELDYQQGPTATERQIGCELIGCKVASFGWRGIRSFCAVIRVREMKELSTGVNKYLLTNCNSVNVQQK
jgi:hypothetical protein